MTTTNRKQKPIPSSADLLTETKYADRTDDWGHTRTKGAVATQYGIVSVDQYNDRATCFLQLSIVLHGVEYVRMISPGRWFLHPYLVTLARRFAEEMAAQHSPRHAIYQDIETAIAHTIRQQRDGTIGPRTDIERAGWVHAFAKEAADRSGRTAAATEGRLAGTRLHLIHTAAAAIVALQHLAEETNHEAPHEHNHPSPAGSPLANPTATT